MGFSHYSNGRKADYGYYYETYYIDNEISEMKKWVWCIRYGRCIKILERKIWSL